jgi:catalase
LPQAIGRNPILCQLRHFWPTTRGRLNSDLTVIPLSFATESFYSNNALIFVNSKGERRAGRYFIVPLNGPKYLDAAAAKAKSPGFLSEELAARLRESPVRFRLVLQIADPGDQKSDSSMVWPEGRKKMELGVINITSVDWLALARQRQPVRPVHRLD